MRTRTEGVVGGGLLRAVSGVVVSEFSLTPPHVHSIPCTLVIPNKYKILQKKALMFIRFKRLLTTCSIYYSETVACPFVRTVYKGDS